MQRRVVKSEAGSQKVSANSNNSTPNVIDLRNKNKLKLTASPIILALCKEWLGVLEKSPVDEIELYDKLTTFLAKSPLETRIAFRDAFALLGKHRFGSAQQVIRRYLKNSELEIALELLGGFDPHRSSELIYKILNFSGFESERLLNVHRQQLLDSLLSPDKATRSIHELTSILFSFELPFQNSLTGKIISTMPSFPKDAPETWKVLVEKKNPLFDESEPLSPDYPEELMWNNFYKMNKAIRSNFLVAAIKEPDDPTRIILRRFIAMERFRNSHAGQQESLLQILIVLPWWAKHYYVSALKDSRADLLLKKEVLIELHLLAVGWLNEEIALHRRLLLASVIRILIGSEIHPEYPLNFLLDPRICNYKSDPVKYIGIVRDIVGKFRDSYILNLDKSEQWVTFEQLSTRESI